MMVENYVYETTRIMSKAKERAKEGATKSRLPFYFTFGIGQTNQGRYVIIRAEDSGSARDKMFEEFGNKWSMQYTTETWFDEKGTSLDEKWGWTLLEEFKL